MSGHSVSSETGAFEAMAAMTLDVGFFTSEFRLCDKVAEYLADIVAQSHEDPARYANFSSQLINELVEFCFRSIRPVGKIDFNLLKNDECVRVRVGFAPDRQGGPIWGRREEAATTNGHDLMTLADAIRVNLHAEESGDDRMALTADFVLREGVR